MKTAGHDDMPAIPKDAGPATKAVLPRSVEDLPDWLRPQLIAGILGVVTIVALSLVPGDWRPSIGLAKGFEHLIAYLVVAAILTTRRSAGWPQIAGLVVLAGILEIAQVLVSGRDANPADFLGSSIGALLGFGLASLALTNRRVLSAAGTNVVSTLEARPPRLAGVGAVVAIGATMVLISTAAAAGAAGWLGGGLALVMLAIAVIDGRRFIIPDSLNAVGLALGLAHSVWGQADLVAAVASASLRAAVLAVAFFGLRLIYSRLRGRQGIGLGDVKLAAVAGIWLDWWVMPVAVEIAALSALSVYALRRYVLGHPLRSSSRLPFGLFFGPAIWIGWVLQATLMQGW